MNNTELKSIELDIFYLDETKEGFKVGEELRSISLYDLSEEDCTLAEELVEYVGSNGLPNTLAHTDSLGYCHYVKFRKV